ncbi:TIGR03086 family metal-binding protein [Kitasatospora nipponensis]|uniref:TIGR03086 family metal-binding protein n=1 Tax=Kitasatospora nipponensis TaxID=258049 RepID=A0ABN1VXT1_9ACTN
MHTAIQEFAAAFAETASAVRAEQLSARTPCEKFTVAELLDHLAGVLPSSERAARKQPQSTAGDPAPVTPAAVAEYAINVAVAWADPAAYEGLTEFGPGEMPADFAAAITLQELALHGWDLAGATGRRFRVGEDSANTVLAVVEQIAANARATGAYGEPVAVSADASAFDRALAVSGRNPGWSA